MPRQRDRGFNTATLFQVAAIPVITGCIILIGSYYVTGDTLSRHSKEIEALQTKTQKDREDETKSREKSRTEYLNYQQKTNEILGKLDTRLAISETKQETANQTLSKIADELAKINASNLIRR